jgi:UDPglucose 6-dehydrogenase
MKIAIIGSGYVGLVSGSCLAQIGHVVTCVDNDPGKIESLRNNVMPIYEPGLEELVKSNVDAGRLSFTTDLVAALDGCEIVFIAVGTPSRAFDGHSDLKYVWTVAREISENAKGRLVVVTKSTVPVCTGDEVEAILSEKLAPDSFSVVSNPEFLKEGAAIDDFMKPDRIVVGSEDEWGREALKELYRPLTDGTFAQAKIIFTDRRTSELIKYAANAFLATKITFINEMAQLCEQVGANVEHLANGIGTDKRIGAQFLRPGPGYGGSCFPKDTLALVRTAQDFEAPSLIVEAVINANDQRKRAMARKVAGAMGGDVRGKRIALLGLTFKAETDDMRDSPAISIANALTDRGAIVSAYDPQGMEEAARILPQLEMSSDALTAAKDADATVIVTEWSEFRALDLDALREAMAGDLLVDLRNLFVPEEVVQTGLRYVSIGRPSR